MYRDAVTLERIWMRKPHKEIHFSINFILSLKLFQNNS